MTRRLRRSFIAVGMALIAFFCSFSTFAQQNEDSLAFARAQHLQRGINVTQWFYRWDRDYSVQRLETSVTADDLALIAAAGFDHVRLDIDVDPLGLWLTSSQWGGGTTPFMTHLDRAVKLILDHHLSVVIEIHPQNSYKLQLRQGATNVPQFNELWRALATHYASTDPEHVFFGIMQEPFQDDTYHWQGIQNEVARTIRSEAPQHTIIATGDRLSTLDDLLAIEPIGLSNVIYEFHFYQPHAFTHQGADWNSAFLKPLRQIPYPSSPEALSSKLNEEPTVGGKYFLAQYGLEGWDRARLEAMIAYAAKWSQFNHVPVYCSEFGAMRLYSEPSMRAQYLHDVRAAVEENHIGWAMTEYDGSFGLVTKANRVAKPDREVLRALGLDRPTN
jgi:endoglucanase